MTMRTVADISALGTDIFACPSAVKSLVLHSGPGVHYMPPGLLQLTVLRHHWRSDEPAAVCSECGRTFGVRRSTLWPHNAGATAAAMASGSAAGWFQDNQHPGLAVPVRHGSSLPGRRLPAGLRRRSSVNSRPCVVRRTSAAMETATEPPPSDVDCDWLLNLHISNFLTC